MLLGEWPGSLDEELSEPSPIPSGSVKMAIGLPADLLCRRPDVRQAERELAAQTARVGSATADLYPDLTLKGSLGYQAVALDALISPANLISSLGATLLYNIFQGGATRANIDLQDALLEEAATAYRSTILTALEDVENALVALAKDHDRQQALSEAARASEEAARLALDQYEAGLKDFETVLSTQQSLSTLQDNLADSQGAVTLDVISLYQALGGGWSPDDSPLQTEQTGGI